VSTLETIEPTEAPAELEPAALPAPQAQTRSAGSLPSLVERENALDHWIWNLLAAAVVVGFLFANWCYWIPAHPGVDQNGYLVGGRMFAQNLSMELRPIRPGAMNEFDPHQLVGRMWVGANLGTPDERYFPKYPLGFPFLVSLCLWIGGATWGPIAAYWINPIAMTLALAATFLLMRALAGSFAALCGLVVFASSPVTMALTDNPNSHATAVCCAAWGMYLLIRWWQSRGAWRAFGAGFLLGYAATIRYSEGTLFLPLALVIAFNMRWREKESYKQAGVAFLGWLIPVALLVTYNLAAMGTITGYDSTNESLGFSLDYAAENWETMIRQLGGIGLYFVFPFSVLGLVWMFWWSWRVATVLAAWIVPCMLVYTFYYWAPDPQAAQQQGVYTGYLRFFMTILPALAACAYWLFARLIRLAQATHQGAPQFVAVLAMGLTTWIALAVHLQNSTFAAEEDQLRRLMLKMNADEVLASAPAGAVIFCPDTPLVHHLQFVRDYTLYTGETFNKAFVSSLPSLRPDEPQGWEPGRRDALYKRLKDQSQQQLDEQAKRVLASALNAGRRVFFVAPGRENDPFVRRRRAEANGRAAQAAEFVKRFATPDRFDTEVVAGWNLPIVRPPVADAGVKQRGKRADMRGIERKNMYWQIVEVTKKEPGAKK
jgi:hypothetical protein